MKTKQCDITRLANLFKVSVQEKDRVSFLLAYTNGRCGTIEALSAYEQGELLDNLLRTVKLCNNAQKAKLHILYKDMHVDKKELLLSFTQGRTDSTSGLTFDEATALIKELAKTEPSEKLRKTIFSFAYSCGLLYGETDADKKMNLAKLNKFLLERGAVKQTIERQTFAQLKVTVAQFAAMQKNNVVTADNKDAKKKTDELLKELNLSTSK